MVRGRSCLGFYFFTRVGWFSHKSPTWLSETVGSGDTPSTATNNVMIKNHRKKLSLKLSYLSSGVPHKALGFTLTQRTRRRYGYKKNYLTLFNEILPFYDALTTTNQFFLKTVTVGTTYAKKSGLNIWLLNTGKDPKIILTSLYLITETLPPALESTICNVWLKLWRFKYFRTTSQSLTVLLRLKTPQAHGAWFFLKTYKEFFSFTLGAYRSAPRNPQLSNLLPSQETPTSISELHLNMNKTNLAVNYSARLKRRKRAKLSIHTKIPYLNFITVQANALALASSTYQLFIYKQLLLANTVST